MTTRLITNVKLSTDSGTKEQIASEIGALKFAVALIYCRMPKEDQMHLLAEMRQLNNAYSNKLADELQQFQLK
ncbi:hypothetical protein [Xenorhabdus bovienii]|uniref:Putative Srb n=1 Tax=Xenorhabdus bovienii str. Intermedium TaxID=1379677 RepID=A0A077QPH4_XENBV|nr:hypothetical protein [Xenorhabdus bovienii]CDH35248.1 putative Srb [Xenorhabdus bovienii str. Intermedium]